MVLILPTHLVERFDGRPVGFAKSSLNPCSIVLMLTEVAVAGIYLPPFFVYACIALPVFLGVRFVMTRAGVMRHVWHPALFEFALSLCLLSVLVLYV
ncbi:DUF1656 domain-containing protein [Pandoraea sp. ISTKB]|uniref:DUF1656 domain-containing protein n=1 Tax=Pandoraea sp. ISTKB TaxID=1586708 RepID=UPI000B33F5A1|nr:DUF1656 domain-containing protein [Pandoraea sp. ISTKB]